MLPMAPFPTPQKAVCYSHAQLTLCKTYSCTCTIYPRRAPCLPITCYRLYRPVQFSVGVPVPASRYYTLRRRHVWWAARSPSMATNHVLHNMAHSNSTLFWWYPHIPSIFAACMYSNSLGSGSGDQEVSVHYNGSRRPCAKRE